MPREKRTTGMEAISTRISAYAVHVDNIIFQEGFLQRENLIQEKIEEYKKQTIQYLIETQHQHPKPYGIQTPITGFYQDGKFALNHGHHRVQTIRELVSEGTLDRLVKEGVLTQTDVDRTVNIPATRVAPPIGKDEASTKRAEALLFLKQITDNEGTNYSSIEKAKTCALVEKKYGLSQAEIAAILGKSVSQVSNWLKLMDLPEPIQENISDGTIASTLVNELVRDHGETKAVEIIQKAVEKSKANGTKKVTKKDVDPDKLSRKQLREIALRIRMESREVETSDGVVVTVFKKELEQLLSYFD